MERDELARMLEEGLSLEAIGARVGRHPSTVGYWVRKHGLAAAHAERHRNRGGIDRDVLAPLVERGLTIREIAGQLGCAPATVRHWLSRYELQTRLADRRARKLKARERAGDLEAGDRFDALCERHGETLFVIRQDGASSCARCRADGVTDRRRRIKERLVSAAGGRCRICGYDRCLAALQFHHVDAATKRFALAGRVIAWDLLTAEADKCILLCANCHAEVEAGFARLPS